MKTCGAAFLVLPALLICLMTPAFASEDKAAALPGASLYNLPDLWTTQNGAPVHLTVLRGRPVIVAMIYTSCPDVCPMIVENMIAIERQIPARHRPSVRFALFTFDPARDTPARLKAFAGAMKLDPQRWTLFTADAQSVRDLAAALGVHYRKEAKGTYYHSIVISLLDDEGVVVSQQKGIDWDAKEIRTKLMALLRKGAGLK